MKRQMTQADPNVELVAALRTIWREVDAFNPNASMAARSIFEAQEKVWKHLPAIIAALNTRVEPTLHPLPSEEMIEAGVSEVLRHEVFELPLRERIVRIYTAMQRSTPTAPVQGDDAELIEQARNLALSGDFSPDDLGGEVGTMSLRNPDGPALLSIIERIASRLSGDNNAALVEAREAFLDMIADAKDWHDEPDGDETGDHTTLHLVTHRSQMGRLIEALGIRPKYAETVADAIDRELNREPITSTDADGGRHG